MSIIRPTQPDRHRVGVIAGGNALRGADLFELVEFTDVQEAHRILESGRLAGKLLLRVT